MGAMMRDQTDVAAGADRLLSFSIPGRNVRGRVVRLGPALDRILAAHDYPPALKHVLAEALVLAALMGGLLKDDGDQLTLQAESQDGAVELLVCDFRAGELRGYAKHDPARFATIGANPSLETLFGQARLGITFDLGTQGKRYQGIVPLEGATLASAVEYYFAQSEQIPTLIRTAIRSGPEGCVAGGMLIQHLSETEAGRERLHVRMDHPEWEHVAIMAASLRHDELVDPALEPEAIVWRLFHEEEEVRVLPPIALTRGCRCSSGHFEQILARFPASERKEMRNDDGIILVDCAFCSREFAIED